MSWLVGYRLPWQPIEKSSFMVLCVLSIYTHTPKMVTMRCIVFELRLFCCLANQSLCLVTIATRVKRNTFSKTRGHTLRTGMQHALTDVWESAKFHRWKFQAEILYPRLNKDAYQRETLTKWHVRLPLISMIVVVTTAVFVCLHPCCCCCCCFHNNYSGGEKH